MLDVTEKIVAGIGGFSLILTVGLYLYFGVYEDNPRPVPKVVPIATTKQASTTPASRQPPGPSPQEKTILKKLRDKGVRIVGRLEVRPYEVPKRLLEEVRRKSNWGRQLKKAHSKIVGKNRLRVFNIARDSYLRLFGFQDNDIIELIDGEPMEFREDRTFHYKSRAEELFAKLERGEEISVTVSRRGRPVHLTFKL